MKVLCVTWLLAAGGIAAATSAAAEPANREADAPAAPARELPLKDMRKMAIESPVKKLVAGTQPDARPAAANPPPRPRENSGGASGATLAETLPADNPTVEPGRVRWLADFDAARRVAARSGRPVLLFQLMGRLDQRFT